MKRTNQTKYIFIEVMAISFLATAGLFVRHCTISLVSVGFWRVAFALPVLFLMAIKDIKKVEFKDIFIIILGGMSSGADMLVYNYALVNTTLANANLFTNLTAFIIVPVSFYVFKEKVPKYYFVGLATAIIGVVVLIYGKASPTKSNYVGDLCAITSCIFYALYILVIYKMREKYKNGPIVFYGAVGILIIVLITSLFIGPIQIPPTREEFLNLLAFSLCMQLFGYSLFGYAQGMISANLSCVITLFQPVIAAIFSFIAFREKLTLIEMVGIAIVAIGVYICKRQYDNN